MSKMNPWTENAFHIPPHSSVRRQAAFPGWLITLTISISALAAPTAPQWSGIYPHLASFNNQGECGTGAVVPWAGHLWTISYAPHQPNGSDDKLYEIDENLIMTIRPESVGGTPANRMIHRESNQLIIGPYLIDSSGKVRVIPPSAMPGRLTGNARHLTDPANKIYYATMEEGFYEVDVNTLTVRELYRDGNSTSNMAGDLLPGYHGKGHYSGQGLLIYANNGENSPLARQKPDIDSGCLAEWDGANWTVVRRNQFTEVTGPGGLYGNDHPATDPVWSIGWDHRSLMLMLREKGQWHLFRLPKASHCYDGAHGWNTEWPRIREIGGDDLLMTMHGSFWRFPASFSTANTAGITPLSNYLMVIGDFCNWNGRIVLGCDVTAKSEFLNTRKAKGAIAPPGQSQSNLRFLEPGQLTSFGPAIGRGALWLNEPAKANTPSDPYLFAGFERRGVHLAHDSDQPVQFTFEVDLKGNGQWQPLKTITVPTHGYQWLAFTPGQPGQWLRIRLDRDCQRVSAAFQYSNTDPRPTHPTGLFAGLIEPGCQTASGGLIRARGENKRTLHFAADTVSDGQVKPAGYYELDIDMKLRRVEDPVADKWLRENVKIPTGILSSDEASVIFVDDNGKRYRLPKGDASFETTGPLGPERICREAVTERDLFNCHGTFYELPAENAGGFARIRPIATHNRHITDYCSWRGLLVLSGIDSNAPAANYNIIRSDNGQCALWVGAVDDLWQLGRPTGHGGPWKNTAVKANIPSDPYLLTGYDHKTLTLSHNAPTPVSFRIEIDIDGTGNWQPYQTFTVPANQIIEHTFPDGFAAYWLRVVANKNTTATAQLVYE